MATLIVLIVLVTALTALAGAQRQGGIGTPLLATPLITTLNQQAAKIRQARANRCLSAPRFRWDPGHEVPPHMRGFVIRQRQGRLERNRTRPSNCPVDVIYRVFPASTEDAAYRVAYCETGGTMDPYARNASGASGLFQLMPIHWRGKFNPFNALANTRFAYRLSKGGHDWSAWVCQP